MQRRRSVISRRRWALGVAAVAAAALAVAGCSSGSSSTAAGSSASASGSADTAFYSGKTLTFVIPSKPGGPFDAWGRLLANWMGQYLHATIKVTNVPAGNTIVGQNQLAASPANGLYLGFLNIATDVQLKASNTKGLNFDPTTDTEVVGSPPSGATGIFVQSSTPYKNITDLQNAGTQLKAATVTTGSNALIIRTVLGAYGITNVKYITGYDNTADLATGFLRGDGVITSIPANSVVDAIKDSKIRGIVTTTSPQTNSSIYQQMKDVPTLTQMISQDPPTSADGKKAMTALANVSNVGMVVATPKGVPAGEVAALTKALQWAVLQPGLQSAALKEGLNTGAATPPATVQAEMATAFANASTLAPYSSTTG